MAVALVQEILRVFGVRCQSEDDAICSAREPSLDPMFAE
jgi:hypothetical protein